MSSKTAKKPAAGSLQKVAKPVKKPFALKAIGAKAPAKPAASTAGQAVKNNSPFVIEDDVAIPERKRFRGKSLYSPALAAMKPGQSFFVAATIERGVYTTEAEADNAQAEESAKVANRLTGAVRRFTKQNQGFKFTVRTVADPHGVRVWRTDGAK